MENLRISLVQADLLWELPADNQSALAELMLPLQGQTDLVVLPEMFTTGFSMNPHSLAADAYQATIHWMASMAHKLRAVITGSIMAPDQDRFVNRLIWMQPDGNLFTYDKRHLFTLAREDEFYTAGKQRLHINYSGWQICPLICYDLRFPVWSRNTVQYDLLLYVANWPKVRRFAWNHLLIGRAIENVSYVAGVNRIGTDENQIAYSGDSQVLDYTGRTILHIGDRAQVCTTSLSKKALLEFRKRRSFLLDADRFSIDL